MLLRRIVAALSALTLAAAGVLISVVPAQAATTETWLPAATALYDIEIDATGSTAYLVDRTANTVLFVDLETRSISRTVAVNSTPMRADLSTDGSRLYVVHYNSGSRSTTSVINTATGVVEATVRDTQLGQEVPYTVTVNPEGTQAWVGNYGSQVAGSISVISTAQNEVIRHLALGTAVTSISFSRDGAWAYAAAGQTGKVLVISTSTFAVTEIDLPLTRFLATSPTADRVYIAAGATMRVLDTTTNQLDPDVSIPIKTSTSDIAFTPDGTIAYVVGNNNTGAIEPIDTRTHAAAAGMTPIPMMYGMGIAVDPADPSRVWGVRGFGLLGEYVFTRPFTKPVVVATDAGATVRPGDVLTASITADAEPAPTSYAYQWSIGGEAVADARSSTFTVPDAAIGETITVTATPTLEGYGSETGAGTSEPTPAVSAKVFSAAPRPTITGTPTVEAQLSAVAGEWDAAAQLSYQWRADGTPIAGATSASIVLTAELVGADITVDVTGTASGYEPITRTSAPVGPVASAIFSRPAEVGIAGDARVGETLTATIANESSPRCSELHVLVARGR
ncbi:hypothetical protein ACIGCK_06835 [Microbacterium sp. NPDC078428]|uniref:hypothetical protein n=1 Tax=Microbacterium sp. NPDC078428 TaxID=3364190 RepID=UPI0037C767DE